jgi:hypothetical protein
MAGEVSKDDLLGEQVDIVEVYVGVGENEEVTIVDGLDTAEALEGARGGFTETEEVIRREADEAGQELETLNQAHESDFRVAEGRERAHVEKTDGVRGQEADASRSLDGARQRRTELRETTQRAAKAAQEGEAWAADHLADAIEREKQERAERIRREREIGDSARRLHDRSAGA